MLTGMVAVVQGTRAAYVCWPSLDKGANIYVALLSSLATNTIYLQWYGSLLCHGKGAMVDETSISLVVILVMVVGGGTSAKCS